MSLLLNIVAEVAGELLPHVFEQNINNLYDALTYKAIVKDQMKIANKSNVSEDLSDDMYNDIADISNGFDLYGIDLVSTAIKTNNWINYALFYMISDEANIIPASKDCRELVNAIAIMADFGRIYVSDGAIDLWDYDVSNPKRLKGSKFLLREEDIRRRITDPNFVQMMNIRKTKMMNRYIRKEPLAIGLDKEYFGDRIIDPDGYITPVFFNPTPLKMEIGDKKGNILDSNLYSRLEDALSDIIDDAKYSYKKDENTGLLKLIIQRDDSYGAYEEFILDDGSVCGGSDIYVMGSYNGKYETDNIFVSANKHKDIVYKILNISFYMMNMYEVKVALDDMIPIQSIYNWVDFSNTNWFDRLTFDERNQLAGYLYNIETFMRSDPNLTELPRLRFKNFTDINNFMLVSDCLVVSPLEELGYTSKDICEGLSFTVANGMITQYFGGYPNVKGIIQ